MERSVIGTCPCFRYIDGVPVCLNGGSIEEVELFDIHPEIVDRLSFMEIETQHQLPICYGCVRTDDEGTVRCASQDNRIVIQNHDLLAIELEEALSNFPRDMFTTEQDICSECLYKVLISLVLLH